MGSLPRGNGFPSKAYFLKHKDYHGLKTSVKDKEGRALTSNPA